MVDNNIVPTRYIFFFPNGRLSRRYLSVTYS